MNKSLIAEIEAISQAIFQKDKYFQTECQLTYGFDTVDRELGVIQTKVGYIKKSLLLPQTAKLVYLVAKHYLIKDREPVPGLFEGCILLKYQYRFSIKPVTTSHELFEKCLFVSEWLSKTFPDMEQTEIEFLSSSDTF